MEESSELETVEKGEDGVVRTWLKQIDLARKNEKNWRRDAKTAISIYSNDVYKSNNTDRKEMFNIFWANVETKRPALYSNLPRPDIRRRFKDNNQLGKVISELLERATAYTLDCSEADSVLKAATNDMLLAGRGVTRIKYAPTIEEDEEGEEQVIYEEVVYEQVQWDEFTRGPGDTWAEVPFIVFDHKLTKEQMEERFEEFADKVSYDVSTSDKDDKNDPTSDDTVFKRCLVHEIWNKDEREIIFIAPSYKDKAIGREDDPLKLKDFFPIPCPLYAIQNSTSLVPATEYSMYQTLAEELEQITKRIKRLISGLRLRGIYDSTIAEMTKIFDADDNEFIPATDLGRLIEAGGLEKAIWQLPMEMYSNVLEKLYIYRQSLIQQIYEITGISDILRGDTQASETLGAQKLKAQYGSQRLQEQQKEVQRYARDLLRLTSEVICEKFSPETLTLMTGMSFPTQEQKMQAQQMMQMQQQMQQPGQPPQPVPEEIQAVLSQPSWEEVEKIMKDDVLIAYRIDIETDSTIQANQQEDQQAITTLLGMMAQYFNSIGPAIESGAISMEAANKLGVAFIRKFRMGRDVEDAFEESEKEEDKPKPEDQAAQVEKQKADMEMQMQQAESQARIKQLEMEGQMKQLDMQTAQAKSEADLQKIQMQMAKDAASHAQDMERIKAEPKVAA